MIAETEPRPEHCSECGAYLSTKTDQDLHTAWHQELFLALVQIGRYAIVRANE